MILLLYLQLCAVTQSSTQNNTTAETNTVVDHQVRSDVLHAGATAALWSEGAKVVLI